MGAGVPPGLQNRCAEATRWAGSIPVRLRKRSSGPAPPGARSHPPATPPPLGGFDSRPPPLLVPDQGFSRSDCGPSRELGMARCDGC